MSLVSITIKGMNKLMRELDDLANRRLPAAQRAALKDIAREVHGLAFENLSGPGRTPVRLRTARRYTYSDGNIERRTLNKTRKRGQFSMLGAKPGSYPVPVVAGNLRRLLGFVDPGESVSSNGLTFTAGDDEAIVFDSAEYAKVIHDGTRSSARYGPRRYIADALAKSNAVEIAEGHVRGAVG